MSNKAQQLEAAAPASRGYVGHIIDFTAPPPPKCASIP